jgi:alkylation response protein AidB-like acyl-CoA dehydrogenase
VRVPQDYLLGELGRGLAQALQVLDGGRIGIGALGVGLAQAAFEAGRDYAKERHAFGKPIAEFQAIQWMLADAATEIEAARLMVYRAAWVKQQGQPFALQAAMGKLLATEVAERVCRNAIQITAATATRRNTGGTHLSRCAADDDREGRAWCRAWSSRGTSWPARAVIDDRTIERRLANARRRISWTSVTIECVSEDCRGTLRSSFPKPLMN